MPGSLEIRQIITNALQYWERGRLIYNAALVAVTAAAAAASGTFQHFSWALLSFSLVHLLVLAVVANILFSVVYPIEIFLQYSDFRNAWISRRWMLLLFGTVFACVLAVFIVSFGLLPITP